MRRGRRVRAAVDAVAAEETWGKIFAMWDRNLK